MHWQEITSIQNPQVKAWRALASRRERLDAGCFLIEGVKMAEEAARHATVRSVLFEQGADAKFAPLLAQLAAQGAQLYAVSTRVLEAVCQTKTPQGIAATVRLPEPRALSGPLLIALDGVQDPGNVGTIIRTADAAGFEGVLLTGTCADVYSAKALRATMGSIFRMAIRVEENLPDALRALHEDGYEILSTELSGTPFYARAACDKAVLVIGNESAGVSPEVSREATQRLRLPMRGGAESLNAAVAAGIMMYELGRQLDAPEGV